MANEKRLIDAKRIRYELDIALMESYGKRRVGLADAIEIINMMPTVDVVEVVHGYWIWCGADRWNDAYACSVCGKMTMEDGNYCPNCGAKMDGDGNAAD